MTASTRPGYPWFGIPPDRRPRPACEEPSLCGKRVILSTPEGFVYDMRAVSDLHLDERNRYVVDITTEQEYYRAMWSGEAATSEPWASQLVWVEA